MEYVEEIANFAREETLAQPTPTKLSAGTPYFEGVSPHCT